MNIWFVYDNHTFYRVGDSTTSRAAMEERALQAFAEDGCGSLFARDHSDRTLAACHGTRQANGRYGVNMQAMSEFFDRVDDHVNWIARG